MQTKLRLLGITLSVILLSFVTNLALAQTAVSYPIGQEPTVTSDKDDYRPGETAVIRGTGWTLDQLVEVHFEEDPAHDHHHGYHNTVVNSDGTWQILFPIEERHIGVKFTVVVEGQISKYIGYAYFTDAEGGDVLQWADAPAFFLNWQNSLIGSESDYFQGEVVPFVYNLSGLAANTSYTFNIDYDYYNNGTNSGGYAYITTYNISRSPAFITPSPAPTIDNSYTGSINGVFYTRNANITSVSAPTNLTTGTITRRVTVTFTTGSGTSADIYWGMYLAKRGTVSDAGTAPTLGSGDWPGGSLQVELTGIKKNKYKC